MSFQSSKLDRRHLMNRELKKEVASRQANTTCKIASKTCRRASQMNRAWIRDICKSIRFTDPVEANFKVNQVVVWLAVLPCKMVSLIWNLKTWHMLRLNQFVFKFKRIVNSSGIVSACFKTKWKGLRRK